MSKYMCGHIFSIPAIFAYIFSVFMITSTRTDLSVLLTKWFDSFLKSVVRSDYGMSIRDVMDTDYEHLMAILQADNDITEPTEEKVMSIGEFVGTISQ